MNHQPAIDNKQHILIQGVTDNTLTLNIDGRIEEIRNAFAEMKGLLEKLNVQTFQSADKIYNIGQITEANFGFITGKKSFNEVLTRRIMPAIKPYSPAAHNFLDNVTAIADWETQNRISGPAKNIITSAFVGVIGFQLRKLMAIGMEALSETKQKNYIEHCLLTAKRSLQLLCFALLSDFWDYKTKGDYTLSEKQAKTFEGFFDGLFELDIEGYLTLLKTLIGIFKDAKLPFSLPELAALEGDLQPGSAFIVAFDRLQAINRLLDSSQYTLVDCLEAETKLTDILEVLNFLARYKMISIKGIAYYEAKYNPARYLHHYSELGSDTKIKTNAERLNYVPHPINTDAILLYTEDYQKSVNLFPFIIDENALAQEIGAKICFYTSKDVDNNSLTYSIVADNSTLTIGFKNVVKLMPDINELMMDPEKRKIMKLDTVFLLFKEARDSILAPSSTKTGM